MINTDKIKELNFNDLVKLKEMVNEIVLRTHITGTPTNRWSDFNELLSFLNKTIENKIYEEYLT